MGNTAANLMTSVEKAGQRSQKQSVLVTVENTEVLRIIRVAGSPFPQKQLKRLFSIAKLASRTIILLNHEPVMSAALDRSLYSMHTLYSNRPPLNRHEKDGRNDKLKMTQSAEEANQYHKFSLSACIPSSVSIHFMPCVFVLGFVMCTVSYMTSACVSVLVSTPVLSLVCYLIVFTCSMLVLD